MNTTTFNLAAIQERNPQRQMLAADVEAFLANGGRVTHCGNTLDPLVQRQSDRLPQELTVVPAHKRRAKAAPRKHVKWTPERKQLLRDHYATMDLRELADQIGCSVNALCVQASLHGLKRQEARNA